MRKLTHRSHVLMMLFVGNTIAAVAQHAASTGIDVNSYFQFGAAEDSKYRGRQTVSVRELRHRVPEKALKLYQKGRVLLEKRKAEDAIPLLQKSVNADPGFTAAQNDLAVAYLQQSQPDLAIEHLQTVLDCDPSFPEVDSNLAIAYIQAGQITSAESAARQALKVNNRGNKARLILGVVLLLQNKFTHEVVDLLTRAESEFPEAGLMLARVSAAHGDIAGAKSKIMKYLSTGTERGRDLGQSWLLLLERAERKPH
jgi:Flp pilus assembly protein TadD